MSERVTPAVAHARDMRSLCAGRISEGSTDLNNLAAYRHWITVSMLLGDLTKDQAENSIESARDVFTQNIGVWAKEHRG